jgi:cysteine sulfinate desulfinase/cysteine desulfurase-like protein
LLRGSWSSDGDLDGPLPFTEAHPLETIGPGLVGVWRTRLAGQAVLSGGHADEAEPAGTERLDAAARLVDAVTAAKADASTAASVRAVESRMEGARAALVARVSATPADAEPRPGDTLPEQDAGPDRRRGRATPDA